MKAVVIRGREELAIEERPLPEPGPGEVRLRIEYVGICGSDLHYYYHGANGTFVVREPLIPGHEPSGVIDYDPSGELAAGTPVTIHPATFGPPVAGLEDLGYLRPGGAYLGSASTWPHTQGAMQQYLVVRRDMVRLLPAGLSLVAAALAEPLAVAIHGVKMAGGDLSGQSVLVCGSGPIGLLTVVAAQAAGAKSVAATDMLTGPLERARLLGADTCYQVGSDDIPAAAFDVVFECVGVPASISAAIRAAKIRGTVAQVGIIPAGDIGVALAPLGNKELTLIGVFRFDNEIDDAIELLAGRPEIAQVVSHVIPADDAVEAFAIARDSQASGKVLVQLW